MSETDSSWAQGREANERKTPGGSLQPFAARPWPRSCPFAHVPVSDTSHRSATARPQGASRDPPHLAEAHDLRVVALARADALAANVAKVAVVAPAARVVARLGMEVAGRDPAHDPLEHAVELVPARVEGGAREP